MQRKTAILTRELNRYDVDIAALSETHLTEEGQLTEVGAGYTIVWKGRPTGEKRQSGVVFVIKTSLVDRLDTLPYSISNRLMSFRVPLSRNRYLIILSAYASATCDAAEVKQAFYDSLNTVVKSISPKEKFVL